MGSRYAVGALRNRSPRASMIDRVAVELGAHHVAVTSAGRSLPHITGVARSRSTERGGRAVFGVDAGLMRVTAWRLALLSLKTAFVTVPRAWGGLAASHTYRRCCRSIADAATARHHAQRALPGRALSGGRQHTGALSTRALDYRLLSVCTASTSTPTCSGFMSGDMPWPRLKTWPSREPPLPWA